MARINFETSVYKEQGFIELCIYTKDRQKAKGICLELWELAQKFWFPNKLLIPHDEFKASDLPEILYSKNGLAEFRENGIYARGAKEAFDWLFQKQIAGQKSGESRKKKSKKKGERVLTGVQRTLTDDNVSSTSLLSSPSSLLSSQDSQLHTLDSLQLGADAKAPPIGAEVVGYYCEVYKVRYNHAPLFHPKDAKQLKALAEDKGVENVKQLLGAYLKMNSSWFITKSHDIQSFLNNLNQVQKFLKTGQLTTQQDAKFSETGSSLNNQLKRLAGK